MKKQEKDIGARNSMRKQVGLAQYMGNAVAVLAIQLNLEGKNVYNLYTVYINH